ncbi:MAG: hypothetical protein ACE5H1_04450, partial [Thermodesulfobacteriota bacterium]
MEDTKVDRNSTYTPAFKVETGQAVKSSARNDQPTISLCMIVKNEEEFLPRCLDSVQDYVD